MATVHIKHLGLAAYLRLQDQRLLRVENRHFVFETDRTVEAWRIEYNNSCCMKHDAFVCELRNHLQSG